MLDVLVAGAGAAGLFAATAAASRGARTLLLERNARPGVKILASGGTRCNVAPDLPAHEIARWFGRSAARFLGPPLRRFDTAAVRALLQDEGVPTYEAPLEKIFPASERARDVLEAFLRRLRASGAELRCGARATGVERTADGFRVVGPDGLDLAARRLVLAVGGRSYPKTGTVGDGYALAAQLGHTIVEPRPALVPLVVETGWVRRLSGIAIEDAVVRALSPSGKVLLERRRPLLFAHFGLSGPGAMDVSRFFGRGERNRLQIDLLPALEVAALREAIAAAAREHPLRAASAALPATLPERLREGLLEHAGIAATRRCNEWKARELDAIAAAIKKLELPVAGDLGFDKAEVTSGGVALREVDPDTMESRVCPGLHVCGELLDLDGPIGGFNFIAAFATGRLAGESAADQLGRS